ncbi:MAG TPA: NAD(P)H-dependent oxidoreductase, partial [Caldimonas sp.]|nr:NAD(P)H-dependent oxidoreductase [Caldimonas sp.]
MSANESPTSAAAAQGAEILVLVAHPELEQSRANRRLLDAALAQHQGGNRRVAVRDLYALYPDYLVDVDAEQAALAAA